jgi:hypothetical protein
VGFNLGFCLQGHTKWVGDFSTLVDVYKDGNKWNLLGEIRVLSCYLVKLVRTFLQLLVISYCFILFLSKTLGGV